MSEAATSNAPPSAPFDASIDADEVNGGANSMALSAGGRFSWLASLPPASKFLTLNKRMQLIIGGTAGAVLLGMLSLPLLFLGGKDAPKEVIVQLGGPLVQHELPLFIADLTPGRRRSSHIKMKMIVEIDPETLHRLVDRENSVISAITAHLRDQSREDLYGKEGVFRLRRELMGVINQEISPASVASILFTEFLVD